MTTAIENRRFVSFRADEQAIEQIRELAIAEDRTVSAELRRAVDAWIDQNTDRVRSKSS